MKQLDMGFNMLLSKPSRKTVLTLTPTGYMLLAIRVTHLSMNASKLYQILDVRALLRVIQPLQTMSLIRRILKSDF
jgi:hypothetical protein